MHAISQQNQQFLASLVDAGRFPSEDAAVDAAVEEMRRQTEDLRTRIHEAVHQLETGQYLEFDDESLEAYFNELNARIDRRAAERAAEE